jgi:hypothetical protein
MSLRRQRHHAHGRHSGASAGENEERSADGKHRFVSGREVVKGKGESWQRKVVGEMKDRPKYKKN